MPGGMPPQVKPGPLDYVLGALFQHQTPIQVNEQANMANQQAMGNQARLAGMAKFFAGLGGAYGAPQGGAAAPQGMIGSQAPSMSPDPSGGAPAGLAPMGNMLPNSPAAQQASPPGGAGAGAGFRPPSGNTPNLAQLAPTLIGGAMLGLPGIDQIQKIAVDAQPDLAVAADGTVYNRKDAANIGRRFAQAPADGVDYSIGQNGQETASPIAGYNPTMGATTAAKQYATSVATPPVPGAVMGPNGWLMPSVTRQTIDQSDSDKADASKAAEARYAFPIAAGSKAAEAQYAGPIAGAQENAKAGAAGNVSYSQKTGDAAADRLTKAQGDLENLDRQAEALKAFKSASDAAGSGKLNTNTTQLQGYWQTLTGQSYPKLAAQQTFSALAPTIYQGLPGLQIRNEREFNLATSRVPTLDQDPQARARAIGYAQQVVAQKRREAQLIVDYANANKGSGGLLGTRGIINGRPATVDDYIKESRARNPITY